MNDTKKPKGIERRKPGVGSNKCNILIYKKLKGGVLERRQTDQFTKAASWLRRNTFEEARIRMGYAWYYNEGTYWELRPALHFMANNWADYRYWREEGA